MSKSTVILFPKSIAMLKQLGENLRRARLRRNVTSRLEAERAGISMGTLAKVERGVPAVSLGSYMQVLVTLNLDEDILEVGADDVLGRKLQDLGLPERPRHPEEANTMTSAVSPGHDETTPNTAVSKGTNRI